jgi:tRNA nucleotidyltransferase/poly(A) polymerase
MNELKIKPGPKVGEILSSLFDEVVAKKIENERNDLLKKLENFRKNDQ